MERGWEREIETKRQIFYLLIHSPGLVQAEARKQELHHGLPCGFSGLSAWTNFTAFLAGVCIRNGAG